MAKTLASQAAFLSAFANVATITHAAKIAGIDPKRHYEWLADDGYEERFQAAEQEAVDVLEREARRRAVAGVEEPVGWYKGEPGGYVRRYSDTLLIFLLNGARPEKYKRCGHEHRFPDGPPSMRIELVNAGDGDTD